MITPNGGSRALMKFLDLQLKEGIDLLLVPVDYNVYKGLLNPDGLILL